ncbi:MAG: cation:proton antiporter [Gammaproteobacteria bacterium]|nr:MAG: cation:proton antiporter [Gammaproteobacteria bacterium]
MSDNAEFVLSIGAFLLLGLAADVLGRRTVIPRVTLILCCGILIGDEMLGLIPDVLLGRFPLIADMALMMVGFLLGGRLRLAALKADGAQVMWISIVAALGTMALVTLVLRLLGVHMAPALLLGCVAAATASAATLDTLMVYGTEGRFTRLLSAIVAIDDAWALILFSLGLAAIGLMSGENHIAGTLQEVAWDIGGAILVGGVIGLPAAYLTGRVRPGQPMLMEALGLVLLCGGTALMLEVSYLIACMTMGVVIANLAAHHDYPFHEIENIEWPFMVVFFMLAGASLELAALLQVGLVAVAFVAARVIGKIAGAAIGAAVSGAGSVVTRWMGLALLPQAGVAIGMALLAGERYPAYQDVILPVVIGTTVIFELSGPIATRISLSRAARAEQAEEGTAQV